MAFAWPICRHPGRADLRIVPANPPGPADICGARLRVLCLSAGIFSARMFLARRVAFVEPLQRLRCAFPGAMEHHATLSAISHLPAPALALVAQPLLSAAPVRGGYGHVFSGSPLGGRAICRRGG